MSGGVKMLGFRVSVRSCQSWCVNMWACVWLDFGCFGCAGSTPSAAGAELRVLLALKGRWAPWARPGGCGSSPWSSRWQMLACWYHHPCLEIRAGSFAFFPPYSVDVKYERVSWLQLGLPSPPCWRRSERLILLEKWGCLVTLVLQVRSLSL